VFQSTVIAVIDMRLDLANGALKYGVLVDLHVEMTPAVFLDALVLPRTDAKQSKFSVGCSVAKTPSHEPVVIGKPESAVRSGRKHAREFIAECVIDELIRIEEQHPRRRRRMCPQKPIPLLGESPVPLETHNPNSMLTGDIRRAIRRGRVDHHDMRKATEPPKKTGKRVSLVSDRDGNRHPT